MSDDNGDTLKGHFAEPPFWRSAVEKFLEAGFAIDDVIPHEWFFDALGVDKPHAATPKAEADKSQLRYAAGMEKLSVCLLCDYNIFLHNERGIGYRWISPSEQTEVGYQEMIAEMQRAIRRGARRLYHVDRLALTFAQQQQNADALAKLAALQSMRRKVRNLPGPKEEGEIRTGTGGS